MDKLEIIYLPPESLTPYENNARVHPQRDIEIIKKSIMEFGFSDAIGIYGEKNIIVEGHGRQQAALQLGLKEVPCVRLDHMTEAQRKAYTLAHNRTAEMSTWDYKMLDKEIGDINIHGINMGDFGFGARQESDDDRYENPVPGYVNGIQYIPTGRQAALDECVDTSKYDELISDIDASAITEDEKAFLKKAAARHLCFDYQNIAEYYCNASPEMQALMEESALVIIDLADAIKYGYAELSDYIMELSGIEDDRGG